MAGVQGRLPTILPSTREHIHKPLNFISHLLLLSHFFLLSSHKNDTTEDRSADRRAAKLQKLATAHPFLVGRTYGAKHMPELVDLKPRVRWRMGGLGRNSGSNVFFRIPAMRNFYTVVRNERKRDTLNPVSVIVQRYCTLVDRDTCIHGSLAF